MEKKIVCYDIDGTLTTGMIFIPLIQSEYADSLIDDSTYESIAQTLSLYKAGSIAYEDAVQQLIEKHARGLVGKSVADLMTHSESFLRKSPALFRAFGHEVIALLQSNSLQFAVTAEPQYIANAVANHLGLDGAYSTTYEVDNGKFTGRVKQSLAHRSAKAELLSHYDIFCAFGDSEGDIDMLENAQHAYCVNPTDGLRERALLHTWKIYDGNDLSIVSDVKSTLQLS